MSQEEREDARLKGYRPAEPKIERIPAGGYSYVTVGDDEGGDRQAAKITSFSMSIDDTSKTDEEYFDKIIDANSPRNRAARRLLKQRQQQQQQDSTMNHYYYGSPPPQTASREAIASLLEQTGKGVTKFEIVQSRSRCPYCNFMTWNRYVLSRHIYDHPEEQEARRYRYKMEKDYRALLTRQEEMKHREEELAIEKAQLLQQIAKFESCDDTKDIAFRIKEGSSNKKEQAQDSEKEDVLTAAALNPVG